MAADLRLILLMLGVGIVTYFIFRTITSARYKKKKELDSDNNTAETDNILVEYESEYKNQNKEEDKIQEVREFPEFETEVKYEIKDEIKHEIKETEYTDPLLSGYTDYSGYIDKKQEKIEAVPVVEKKSIDTEAVKQDSCMEKVVIEDIISICILPRNRRTFTGRSILTTLKTMNFVFTEKHVFQRFQEPDTKDPLFTVASMVEPGTFNIHTLGAELLPGLVLFLTLPHPKGALSSFESMLSNARQLASILGGDLCDSKRNHLTGQTIVHYRERVQEHLRKQLTKMRATENA